MSDSDMLTHLGRLMSFPKSWIRVEHQSQLPEYIEFETPCSARKSAKLDAVCERKEGVLHSFSRDFGTSFFFRDGIIQRQ